MASKKAVRLDPGDQSSIYRLGEIHLRLGNYQEAVDHLERAISGFPFPYQRYYNLGVGYAHLQQYDKAIENFQKCIEEQPSFAPRKET